MAVTFLGFYSPPVGTTEVLYDIDLIKQDLLNCFYTKKGERVMDADYGFIGHDLIFNLDSPGTAQALESDARRIISLDPRVELVDIVVQNIQYGYQLVITLNFIQLNTVDELVIPFTTRMQDEMK